MAFGFTPQHNASIPLGDFSQSQFVALCFKAVEQCGWKTKYLSEFGLIAFTERGAFKPNQQIEIRIANGMATIKSESIGSEIYDRGFNKKNVDALLESLDALGKSIFTYQLDQIWHSLHEFVTPANEDILNQPPPTRAQEASSILNLFVPKGEFFITPIIVNINILIFIAMVISGMSFFTPDSEIMIQWGANFKPYTLDGQPWRMITACFLHFGILHLAFNMYALIYIGMMLEPLLGRIRFAIAYLLAGVGASAVSLWWHEYSVSAGASGAIFGMYGVFIALLTSRLINKAARMTLMSSMALFVGYNLLFGLSAGIDNAAHIGGLVSGILIGYIFLPSLLNPNNVGVKIIGMAGSIVVFFGLATFEYLTGSSDLGVFDAKMKVFYKNQRSGQSIYNYDSATQKMEYLQCINDSALAQWKENIIITEEIAKLEIPDAYLERNRSLLRYSRLRLSTVEAIKRSLEDGSDLYTDEINNYHNQISQLLDSLNNQQIETDSLEN